LRFYAGDVDAQQIREFADEVAVPGGRSSGLADAPAEEPAASHPFAEENAIRVILRRVGERAGVGNVHPHRFRRTFATWAIEAGAHETDVMLLLGHSTLAMTHHYAQTYSSQQAVRAHAALSPVAQLRAEDGEEPADGVDMAAATTGEHPIEDRAPDLRSSPNGASHVVRSEPPGASPAAPAARREGRMTTAKAAIEAGQTLVGKYRGEEHTCEVVAHDERLYFVRPNGEVFTSPSAAGKAVTGTATNGYRFWSIPEQAPSGQQGRQKAAREAVAAVTADVTPSTADGAHSASGAAKPAKMIQRAKSQKDVPDDQVRYSCSSCMEAFEACPQGHPALDAG
jgi:hypothetical protein